MTRADRYTVIINNASYEIVVPEGSGLDRVEAVAQTVAKPQPNGTPARVTQVQWTGRVYLDGAFGGPL
jgi:hypothetical protein